MTTTLFRGSEYSRVELIDIICSIYSCVSMDEDEIDNIADSIIDYVNEKLPADMIWYPYLSEVVGDIDNDMDEEEFSQIFNDLLEKAFINIEN